MIWETLAASGMLTGIGSVGWALWTLRRWNRRSTAQNMFYASLGHELKTPLNGIIGFADLIQSGGFEPEEQQQFARDIRFSAETLLSMINNMLDCARFHAGRMPLHPRLIDFGALIRELPVLLGPLLRAKHLRLEIELPTDLPLLRIDPERVRQILLNLIGNAIKFSDHGVVALSGTFRETGPLHGRLTLKVIDRGPGIAKKYRKTIFEPFVQQRSHAATGKGTGLGLFITRNLVELMHGAIELESEPGNGCCFTVTIPNVPYEAPKGSN